MALAQDSSIHIVNHAVFAVDHNFKRVHMISYKDEAVTTNVFLGYDITPSYESLNHYPNLVTSLTLPKLKPKALLKIPLLDDNRRLKMVNVKLSSQLYFAHHHYAKYYVYGLIPAVVLSLNSSIKNHLYTGMPIFNSKNQLVSFVTDCHIEKKCVVLVTGETHRVGGMFCIDGCVRLLVNEEILHLPPFDCIDVHVRYTKKKVRIYLVYNNQVLSNVDINALFAGNVLIR
ncbi:P26 [Clanis bilineata nucleopolyhedrovirus]|uniref:p26 n=1 Tax=Clanis bilineata nucleopolyhedrovirus TaxID=1307957 RepID=Q0N440_9ABAC|nr:P26 [Clanis bilineata nucleopolyhedrovirus]ABF47403.1 P26 [Clanis bilineata nucleopolyhedrovirus]